MTASALFHQDPGPAPSGITASVFVDADGLDAWIWEGPAAVLRGLISSSTLKSSCEVYSETGPFAESPPCDSAEALIGVRLSRQLDGKHGHVEHARRTMACVASLRADKRGKKKNARKKKEQKS